MACEEGLSDRLARVERTARWLSRVCVLLGLVLAAAISMGQAEGEALGTCRATRFELVDKEGEVVGVIGTESGHYPFLSMSCGGGQGSGGSVRLEVPSGIGPGMRIADAKGRMRMHILLGGKLGTSDDGKVRLVEDQIPQVLLMGSDGSITARVGSGADGGGLLEIRESNGRMVFKRPE